MTAFQENFDWQQDYLMQVRFILRRNAHVFVDFVISNEEQDRLQATDMVLTVVGGGTVAVRIRRPDCRYRDFTVRSRTRWGNKTELHKLREGWARWYLYGWANAQKLLAQWVLLDLDAVRASDLLEMPRRDIPNGDGTYFISIPLKDLRVVGAVVSEYPSLSVAKG